MGALMSKSDVARLRNVTPAAVSRALLKGRLFATPGGEIDLGDPRNSSYLMGTRAPGRPKGSRSRKPKAPPAPSVAPDFDDGDQLPDELFVTPSDEGSVALGRLAAQRSRIIAAIRLFRYKFDKYQALYVPTRLAAKVLGWHIGQWAELPDAFDGLDMKSDDLWMQIDAKVNEYTDKIRADWAAIVEKETPPEPVAADDGLGGLDLESLRAAWDEGHAERTRFLLSVEKNEYMTVEENDRRVADFANEIRAGAYVLGRRCSARCRALAETGNEDEARSHLHREAQDAIQRLERHRLTPPAVNVNG